MVDQKLATIYSKNWLLTNLHSLWVPPAPGRRPSWTSGAPSWVFLSSTAMR